MIVVHVTHEAVEKIGGIGTVVGGLMTTEAYNEVMDWVIPYGKGRVYVTMLGHLWKQLAGWHMPSEMAGKVPAHRENLRCWDHLRHQGGR